MSRSPLVSSFVSEWHKLRKRPANLIMASILVVSIVLFAYILPYVQFLNPRLATSTALLSAAHFYPQDFLRTTIALAPFLSILALIVGALMGGSEYSYGTLKAVFTQGPSRPTAFFGGFGALAFFLFYMTVLAFATGAITSVGFAIAQSQSLTAWPAALALLEALGATWLIFVAFAAFGLMLAHLFKQPSAAIGLGIAYLILIENLIVHYLLGANSTLDAVLRLLPTSNSQSLVAAFSPTPLGSQALVSIVPATQAVFMLALYIFLFVLLTAAVLRRRDVV
jgi:ABC-type transport system involved in multi-copper enzyme maturation permease subunit